MPKVSKYMCADIQTSKIDFCLFTSPLKIVKFLNREWGGGTLNTFFTENLFDSFISINNGVIKNKYLYYSCRTVGLLHKMLLKG